jgi:hypothetical protein
MSVDEIRILPVCLLPGKTPRAVQRKQLANILYRDVWVDGPRVEDVQPQPELEPLFAMRTGAAQPTVGPKNGTTPHSEGLSHAMMAGATPMGVGAASATFTGWSAGAPIGPSVPRVAPAPRGPASCRCRIAPQQPTVCGPARRCATSPSSSA